MSLIRTAFVCLGLLFAVSLVKCTEFVPCYMWSSQRSNEKVPALRKIGQDTFKDDILEQIKLYDYIVVFAEETLSPEDFAQRDETGGTVYPHLAKFKKTSKTTYLPYVQNPINALKHLGVSFSELPASRLSEDFEIPTEILIVTLNDAKDFENRAEMLKRHDSLIGETYSKLQSEGKNIMAIYTAHHESWVASEDIINARKVRSLLATGDEASPNFYNNSLLLLYLSQAQMYVNSDVPSNLTLTYRTTNASESDIQLELTAENSISVSLVFSTNTSQGYWELAKASLTNLSSSTTSELNSSSSVYALQTFSYHCGDQIFLGENNFKLLLKDFQIQLFFNGAANDSKFADAYDCVGFTSVPIWSGIFVTAILLMILSFGVTMMMDIRTMDRFDDSKGKTITINAAE